MNFPLENPLISVIIPNYNGEKFLRECLESVCSQTYESLEIIFADDGSTDDSLTIAREFQSTFSNFRILTRDSNVGLARNKHEAILYANGEFITSIDSDDFYTSREKIQRELELIQKARSEGNSNIIAYSRVITIDDECNAIGRKGVYPIYEGNIFKQLITREAKHVRDFTFSKSQYLNVGGYDVNAKLYVDWNLRIKLALCNEFYCTHNYGVAYRKHGSGMSSASTMSHIKWINYGYQKNKHKLSFISRFKISAILYKLLAKMLVHSIMKNTINWLSNMR